MKKLFFHDDKHQNVHAEMELGDLTVENKELLEKVFEFLRANHVLDRYRELTIAESFHEHWEDGEKQLSFED